MSSRKLHDGRSDGLTPLESLDLGKVDSFAGLLRAMAKTAFSGRQLGESLEIALEMFRAPSCRVVLTLSGAMTVAKQGRLVCDMIDRGLV
ncbi:MAG: deoxyhypusine synthase family protein, partial [Pirellulales bacterium]|nr:deoxyhypusine synthase family protein [Pirellulales bacterium]